MSEILRKCVGCGEIKPRTDMLKITKDFRNGNIVVNPNSKIFGRSAYLCYNQNCIDTALKKMKLNRCLHTTEDLKGLLDGKYKS